LKDIQKFEKEKTKEIYFDIVDKYIKPGADFELNISGKLKKQTLIQYEKQKSSKEWILEIPVENVLQPISIHM